MRDYTSQIGPEASFKSQAISFRGQPTPLPPDLVRTWGLTSHLNMKGKLSQESVSATLINGKNKIRQHTPNPAGG